MFVPMPVLIAIGAAIILFFVLRGRARQADRDSLMDVSAAAPRSAPKTVPPQEIEAQVRMMLARGETIDAIKLVRDATGMGLKDAKDYVDGL